MIRNLARRACPPDLRNAPPSLLGRLRWVFTLVGVAAAGFVMPFGATRAWNSGNLWGWVVLGAVVAYAVNCVRTYRAEERRLTDDLILALCTYTVGVGGADPSQAGLFAAALFLSVLYGTWGRALRLLAL